MPTAARDLGQRQRETWTDDEARRGMTTTLEPPERSTCSIDSTSVPAHRLATMTSCHVWASPRLLLTFFGAALSMLSACGNGGAGKGNIGDPSSSSGGSNPSSGGNSSSSGGNSSSSGGNSSSSGGSSVGVEPDPDEPCQGQTCSGHGTCVETGTTASCECEEGYVASSLSCIASCEGRPVQPCFTDSGIDADGAIDIDILATRLTGVAPLAVFFDASGTVADSTSRPFHDLNYCWGFGDNSGCFATTGMSRSQATGPVTAHVFEEPGDHVVTLTVRDKDNLQAQQTVTIHVDDPDEVFADDNTVCLAASDDFTGCPSGATQIVGTNLGSLSNHVATNRRLLLRRGDTFQGDGPFVIDEPGPGIVGAFGSEENARPVVVPGSSTAFAINDTNGESFGPDWRIMDIEINGQEDSNARGLSVASVSPDPVDLLLLRLKVADVGRGFQPDGRHITVQDCEFRHVIGGEGHNLIYGSANHFALLGNIVMDSTEGEHVLRLIRSQQTVISNNEMGFAGSPRHVIKLHAPEFSEDRYTEDVVLSDNIVHGEGGHSWTVDLGPQNEDQDQRLRNVIFERNFVTAGPEVAISVHARGEDLSIRNNIFLALDGPPPAFVGVVKRGAEPDPLRVQVYHNTGVSQSGSVLLASVSDSASETSVYNNFAVSPNGPSITNQSGADGGGNVSESSGFDGDLSTWSDFYPPSGSAAIGAGVGDRQTFWDFNMVVRPGTPTAGALEPNAP